MAVRRHKRRARVSLQKDKTKMSNEMRPVETKTEDRNKKALVIAQEIKMARLLADNDKRIRDKVLKRLKSWLTIRSQSSFVFTKADFMSLWKGLFYCMWMSDKMLVQEELAESISKLVHCFNSKDIIVLYISCALQTLATEWFGIDQYRLDKFSMLVRRILRQIFVICKNQSWDMEWVSEISQVFTQLFSYKTVKTGLGFNLHITEIYLEELAKVSNGNLPEDVVQELINPFAVYLITTNDERQMKHIMRHVFRHLIFQSDVGLEYMEKFNAWKRAGFPCARIDDMQKIEISDTEEYSDNEGKQVSETKTQSVIEKPLDPRAGRVDVELPQIPFNAGKIAELLSSYKFHPSSIAKSRRQLLRLYEEFMELSEGKMPLGVKRIRKPNSQKGDMDSKKAAMRLIRFERGLSGKANKKRKRKRNEETVCDQSSLDDPKDGSISDLDSDVPTDVIDSESRLTNTPTTAKADLQDVGANEVPLKKRKKSISTCDTPSNRSEITENKKKKLRMKTTKKSNEATKIKFNKKSNKSTVDKSVKHKTKKAVTPEVRKSKSLDQGASISPISDDKLLLKEINNVSITKKAKSKNKIMHREMPLKNELTTQMKKRTSLNNSMEKKKVIFGLSQNTAQNRSEYLQQIRESPGIPFDANKKPLVGVLKMSPIPSPINPFYKK